MVYYSGFYGYNTFASPVRYTSYASPVRTYYGGYGYTGYPYTGYYSSSFYPSYSTFGGYTGYAGSYFF